MSKISIIFFAFFLTGGFLVFFMVSGVKSEKTISSSAEVKKQEKNVKNIGVEKKQSQLKSVSIIFGGDMMFDRYIRQANAKRGYEKAFGDLKELFEKNDCVVANLEGPVTNNDSVSVSSEFGVPDNYKFTFEPKIMKTLSDYNFCNVNLGNNHIYNFGSDGMKQTKDFIGMSDVHYFGNTGMKGEQRYFVENINSTKIAFVNYNQFINDALVDVLEDIKTAKEKSNFVVAYTHWGKEYEVESREKEQIIAHELVDAGVDIVIGSHPHVAQEKEVYKGKMIYYSLGNLIFDQYFSEETKKGLLVQAIFDKVNDKISFEEYSVKMTPSGNTLLVQ